MTQEEIIRGNILILEFLGFKYCNDDPETIPEGYYYMNDPDGLNCVTARLCEYHESFDCIMPVVYEICKIIENQWPVEVTVGELHAKKIFTTHLNNSIESVWKCVIDFITWYNKNK